MDPFSALELRRLHLIVILSSGASFQLANTTRLHASGSLKATRQFLANVHRRWIAEFIQQAIVGGANMGLHFFFGLLDIACDEC